MDAYFDLSWNIAPYSLLLLYCRLNIFLSTISLCRPPPFRVIFVQRTLFLAREAHWNDIEKAFEIF